ncbi:MAG: single-stranded DNA-binding protein [Patescibacteria group bacterium]
MFFLNRATIIGNVTRDPEMRSTPQGIAIATFTIATNMRWTNAAGEKQDRSEYHNVVAWRRLAEICGQYLRKGMKVYVEGRIQTRTWDDAQGARHWRTEIIADNMIILDKVQSGGAGFDNNSVDPSANSEIEPISNDEQPVSVEDIPF